MYAVVREITSKPGQVISGQEREEYEGLVSALPGFYGQLTVDIGDGKLIRIAVWESDAARTATFGREENRRYYENIEARQNMPIAGRGQIISNTLIKA